MVLVILFVGCILEDRWIVEFLVVFFLKIDFVIVVILIVIVEFF